jgi:hypothetical protein
MPWLLIIINKLFIDLERPKTNIYVTVHGVKKKMDFQTSYAWSVLYSVIEGER